MIGDGNRIDRINKILGDGDGGSELLGASCVGGGLVHNSHAMLVGLYKLVGGGVPNSSSSVVARSAQISSLRSQCKLEYQRLMFQGGGYTEPGAMPHVKLQLW